MSSLLALIRTNWLVFTLFTLVVITILSFWPLVELPSLPGTDKTHHVIAYAILALPTALRKPNRWIPLGLFFVACGGAIELLQPYVNRHGEWLDMLANTAGVVCGFIIAEIVNFFSPANLNRSR